MKTPCPNCDCPRCRCTCHGASYGATKRERSAYNLGNHAGFSLGLRIGAALGPNIITDFFKKMKHKKLKKKGAGAAALLILLVGLIIILTLLFMPPGAREALLNGVP